MGSVSRLAVCAVSVLFLALAIPANAQISEGVAPGAFDHVAEIEGRCPSFSWGEVASAEYYQLMVYLIPPDVDPREVDRETAQEVLRKRVPGSASSWTPNLAHCLTAGEHYVWFVRGVISEEYGQVVEASNWSYGKFFSISSAPSAEEVTAALETLRRHASLRAADVSAAQPDAIDEQRSPDARIVPGDGRTTRSLEQKEVMLAKTAIKGRVTDPTGETYGVVGISDSPNGAGVAATNMNFGGADLVLDGLAHWSPDTRMSEAGIDRPWFSPVEFEIQNSAGGGITLEVVGDISAEVVTGGLFVGDGSGLTNVGGLIPGSSSGDILIWSSSQSGSWVVSPPSGLGFLQKDNMQPFLPVNFAIALQGVFPSRNAAEPFIGEIMMVGFNFPPRNWALCDGQLLPISSYSALFSLLGTYYGGDGRTTFALPDLRGRVPVHAGQGPGLTDRRLGNVGRGGVETH